MTQLVYAIRHNPSLEFMPLRMSRVGFGGWSWWREPDIVPHDKSPRLFHTKQGAVNALSAWMQGKFVSKTHAAGGWDESPYDERELHIETPENPRVREDMEIVIFKLIEIKEK